MCTCLSVYPSTYISVQLSTNLTTYLLIYLSGHMHTNLFTYLHIYHISTYLSIYFSTYLIIYIIIWIFVNLSTHIFIYLLTYNYTYVQPSLFLPIWMCDYWPDSIYHNIYLSLFASVYQRICQFIYQSIFYYETSCFHLVLPTKAKTRMQTEQKTRSTQIRSKNNNRSRTGISGHCQAAFSLTFARPWGKHDYDLWHFGDFKRTGIRKQSIMDNPILQRIRKGIDMFPFRVQSNSLRIVHVSLSRICPNLWEFSSMWLLYSLITTFYCLAAYR